jgi:hypothetical protein
MLIKANLDLQHYLFTHTFDGKLYICPAGLDKRLSRVLDAAIQDPFQRFRANATGSHSMKDEFDDFINATRHPIGSQSPLEWWLEASREGVYSNLRRMAITIFTIPPMSAGPERVFSGTRHIILTNE